MKTIVKQDHIEWLEQQIATCRSIIDNQAKRQATLTEVLNNAKGISGSATLVEMPKARSASGMSKTETAVWGELSKVQLSGMTATGLMEHTKLKRNTIHTAIWSLRNNHGYGIELKNGRYRITNRFPKASGT
tara:strand:- start:49 stop:444 length:396 start_codon:yes stop_codon:yes gene_type:complete